MKKRELVMMLVVVLSLLTACGKGESEDASSTADRGEVDVAFPLSEPITVTAFAITAGEVSLSETYFMDKMTGRTNINWDIQDASGVDLVEKRNLLIGTNDYPDVFIKSGFTINDVSKYGAQGVFIPLQNLIEEYAPNLTRLMGEREEIREIITSGDGNIYSLPEVQARNIPILSHYFMNHQWLENLNLAKPSNLDELYKVLKAFKEMDANGNGDPNDEIPLVTTKIATPDLFAPYMGVPYDINTKISLIDGEFEYFPSSEEYKDLLVFVTKLYSEDLMHTDSFTMEHPQQSAIGKSGDVLGSFFDMGSFLSVTHENSVQYKPLSPFEPEVYFLTAGTVSGTFVITDACETPEVAIAWVDYLYGEEGSKLAWLGIEGISHELYEDGTWNWIIQEGETLENTRNKGGLQGHASNPGLQPVLMYNSADPYTFAVHAQRQVMVEEGSAGVFIPPVLSTAENQKVSSIKADADMYITQYMAQVCTGALDLDSTWGEYLETLDAMGANKMFEIYMTAYDK